MVQAGIQNSLSNGYFVTAFDASIKLLEVVETHKNLEKIESDFLNFKCEMFLMASGQSFHLQHLPKTISNSF